MGDLAWRVDTIVLKAIMTRVIRHVVLLSKCFRIPMLTHCDAGHRSLREGLTVRRCSSFRARYVGAAGARLSVRGLCTGYASRPLQTTWTMTGGEACLLCGINIATFLRARLHGTARSLAEAGLVQAETRAVGSFALARIGE